MRNLDSLLKPKSIAVVGASREKKKLGRLVLDNILDNGFKGKDRECSFIASDASLAKKSRPA